MMSTLPNKKPIVVTYTVQGKAISDFKLEQVYQELVTKGGPFWCSTENLFNRLRLGIVRGEIASECVTFAFDGQVMTLNKYGECEPCMPGFLTQSACMVREIMIGVSEKRIKERENKNNG